METKPQSHTPLYGILAFAVLVLAAFSQFLFSRRLVGEPWQVVATFALGAAYLAFGILCDDTPGRRTRPVVHSYYVIQLLILTVAIFLSPARGIFFVIAMPLISQAVIDYGWRGATLVTLPLYAVSIGVFAIDYGARAAFEVAVGYLPAFLFTIVFSIITKQASVATRQAEKNSADLAASNALLREHAVQAEELATTRERNRLAREIHDGVGHYLTVIKVQLDAAAALLPADPERAAQSVQKAARLAGEALDDVRRSVGTLAADRAPAPLADTLRQLAADAAPVPAFTLEGAPRLLPAPAEHALYRATQEGLTNLRKHSAATAATLTLDFRDPARVRLVLADNGRGAPGAGPNGTGFGLRGLRERIALLGGTVSAGNAAGGGFTLAVEIPT